MLSNTPGLSELLDQKVIGFLTAVKEDGQPQTSPIWFMRDGDDIVIYNRSRARRLRSIQTNPRVAFNLRADVGARSGLTLEGTAVVEQDLPQHRTSLGTRRSTPKKSPGWGGHLSRSQTITRLGFE